MRVTAAVVVYDRYYNLEKWLRAWGKRTEPLLVIHNQPESGAKSLQAVVPPLGEYFVRSNDGMDIGALRDVIEERREEPASWDVLCWFTDDCLPMRPDFLDHFLRPLREDPGVGLVCNYLVPGEYYRGIPRHARTVAFAVRAEVALALEFPAVLTTKRHCWDFEYGTHNMLAQVEALGWRVRTVHADGRPWYACNDVVWDCGEIHRGITWDERRCQDHWRAYEAQFRDMEVRGDE